MASLQMDDGLLLLLSLDDTAYNTAIDHDYMDIDSDNEHHTPEFELIPANGPEKLTPITKIGSLGSSTPLTTLKTGESVEEVTIDGSSYSQQTYSPSILSPTILGARLAVGGPKLLMPPPSDGEETVDFECDTSSFRASSPENTFSYRSRSPLESSGTRNLSRFLPSPAPSQLFADRRLRGVYTPNSGPERRYDAYSNSMSQSFLYRRQQHMVNGGESSPEGGSWGKLSPINVHHHHYYNYTPLKDPGAPLSARKSPLGALEAFLDTQSRLQSLQLLSQAQQHAQTLSLPLPWETKLSPHERVPYMLSSYLQLLANFIATCYGAHIVYSVIRTIRLDVQHKLELQTADLLVEIASCRRAYNENNCSPDEIVPALERQCAYWLKCLSQDPFNGGGNKSSISAETIGVILNSLIQPLGLKFFLVVFGFTLTVFGCNFAFGYVRAKTYYGWTNTARVKGEGDIAVQ